MITTKRNLRTGLTYWETRTRREMKTGKSPDKRFYDVVVIGGGITGALAAETLSHLGMDMLVVDRRPPAHGSTSASTALIQWEIDEPLTRLARLVGRANADRCYRAARRAVADLKRRILRLGIECGMQSRDTLLIAGDSMNGKDLLRETRQRRRIGLPSRFLTGEELRQGYGFKREGAILSKGNIELDPRRLTLGLLQAAGARGVEIVSPADVTSLYTAPNGVLLTLSSGLVIAAAKVIAATGYESLPELPPSRHKLISTWALATVKQPAGALWGARELVWEASDPYLYFRTTPDNRILVGGEDAAFFNPERRDRQTVRKAGRILQKLGQLLPHARLEADYSWAGTFAQSPSGLPVIGPVNGLHNCFAILGAGGNDITFSVIAASLAKAWLNGRPHPLARLFAP